MFELQTPEDDGLFTPVVGPWSRDKHHFLRRYIDAFTKSMQHKRWDGFHYIDLFAGAGVERMEDDQSLDWGSPLLAAQSPVKFTRIHLCELDPKRHDALATRMARFSQPTPPQVLLGDANACVSDIVAEIPAGALSLAFLDPYGLHLHYATLCKLAERRVDFIIFFPDHLDALRNWEKIYLDQPNSNLDCVLGDVPWRKCLGATNPDKWAQVLLDLYIQQIGRLEYQEFEHERIARTDGRFLYKLVFCSRGKVGGRLWRRIAGKKPDGQNSFQFDP